jgi:hypothetical protein
MRSRIRLRRAAASGEVLRSEARSKSSSPASGNSTS